MSKRTSHHWCEQPFQANVWNWIIWKRYSCASRRCGLDCGSPRAGGEVLALPLNAIENVIWRTSLPHFHARGHPFSVGSRISHKAGGAAIQKHGCVNLLFWSHFIPKIALKLKKKVGPWVQGRGAFPAPLPRSANAPPSNPLLDLLMR